MKILVICQYYYPERFLINDIAPELVKRGHMVTVLTGLPNYPSGVINKEYRHGNKRRELLDGVSVIRCFEIPRRKGKFNLLLNYISFALSSKMDIRSLGSEYDIVFCYQLSPITMVAPAIAFKKKYHKPILLYCLDLWPESALAHVHKESGLLYKAIKLYSKNIYRLCDRIAVTSKPFIEYFLAIIGLSFEKLVYIPQHADSNFLNLDLSSEDNGITDFMFAGNLGIGQNLETIIKAVQLLKNRKDFLVHFVGDGSKRVVLEQMTKDYGIGGKVIFHGQKEYAEMAEWYKKADALLITLRGNNYVGNTMPGKLQTYMTTKKPIFGAINGAARQVIEEAQCGACVQAEDYYGLASLMAEYIDYPERYLLCGVNAKRYFINNYSFPVFMDRLENELKETLNNGISLSN